MSDSPSRGAGQPRLGADSRTPTGLLEILRHVGDSELASGCALALRARELSEGRTSRVEFAPDRPPTGSAGGDAPDGSPSPGSDRRWHRTPVRGPGSPGRPEAWLAVALAGDEQAPPGSDRLRAAAAVVGLILERHRLAGEARRARREAKAIRGDLGHAVRGHLHAALLRTDNLLLGMGRDGEADLGELREELETLKGTVEKMVEEIRDLLDAPDDGGERPPGAKTGPEEAVPLPELLREAGRAAAGGGDGPPGVEVVGEAATVRTDPRRLQAALRELFDLARRSRSEPTLTVRPDASASGVRVTLAVDLPQAPRSGPAPATERGEAGGDPAPAPSGPGRAGGDESLDRPSLRALVPRLGGRVWIEAGEGGGVEVNVSLPAAEDE